MSTTRTPRRSSRSSVFGTLFGSGERYEVHSGCFGQYGSAWRCPEGCTLEINSEKLVLHFPQLTSEPPTSLAILISSVTAQDLSIEPLAARSDQPRLRLCLEVAATPSCAEAVTAKQLQRAMSGGPSLCVLQLGLAAAGPLVDGLRLADGPATWSKCRRPVPQLAAQAACVPPAQTPAAAHSAAVSACQSRRQGVSRL